MNMNVKEFNKEVDLENYVFDLKKTTVINDKIFISGIRTEDIYAHGPKCDVLYIYIIDMDGDNATVLPLSSLVTYPLVIDPEIGPLSSSRKTITEYSIKEEIGIIYVTIEFTCVRYPVISYASCYKAYETYVLSNDGNWNKVDDFDNSFKDYYNHNKVGCFYSNLCKFTSELISIDVQDIIHRNDNFSRFVLKSFNPMLEDIQIRITNIVDGDNNYDGITLYKEGKYVILSSNNQLYIGKDNNEYVKSIPVVPFTKYFKDFKIDLTSFTILNNKLYMLNACDKNNICELYEIGMGRDNFTKFELDIYNQVDNLLKTLRHKLIKSEVIDHTIFLEDDMIKIILKVRIYANLNDICFTIEPACYEIYYEYILNGNSIALSERCKFDSKEYNQQVLSGVFKKNSNSYIYEKFIDGTYKCSTIFGADMNLIDYGDNNLRVTLSSPGTLLEYNGIKIMVETLDSENNPSSFWIIYWNKIFRITKEGLYVNYIMDIPKILNFINKKDTRKKEISVKRRDIIRDIINDDVKDDKYFMRLKHPSNNNFTVKSTRVNCTNLPSDESNTNKSEFSNIIPDGYIEIPDINKTVNYIHANQLEIDKYYRCENSILYSRYFHVIQEADLVTQSMHGPSYITKNIRGDITIIPIRNNRSKFVELSKTEWKKEANEFINKNCNI